MIAIGWSYDSPGGWDDGSEVAQASEGPSPATVTCSIGVTAKTARRLPQLRAAIERCV
jgi:hypothetical protein